MLSRSLSLSGCIVSPFPSIKCFGADPNKIPAPLVIDHITGNARCNCLVRKRPVHNGVCTYGNLVSNMDVAKNFGARPYPYKIPQYRCPSIFGPPPLSDGDTLG